MSVSAFGTTEGENFLQSAAESNSQPAVMAALRTGYRRRVLRSCIRDCVGPRPVWESLAEMTGAAEAAIRDGFSAAGSPEHCAVFALGRLGTAEFDVLSDADLLFVYGDSVPGERAAAAAASLVTLLGSYTSDGIVFTVDMRLRPHGNQGELATSASQLAPYFQSEAQPWEALSYTKLRHIAGSTDVARQVAESVRCFHRRFAGDRLFRRNLVEMRARLESSVGRERNFKKGWGGFYDIDFMACGLPIEHGLTVAASDIIARLTALKHADLLSQRDFSTLCHYAEFLRALEHSLRVVYGKARGSLPSSNADIEAIASLVESSLGRKLPRSLPDSLAEALQAVRSTFERIFSV